MKLRKSLLTLGCSLLAVSTLASCSFIREEETELLTIDHAEIGEDEEGNPVLIIYYNQEDYPTTYVPILKGDKGDQGDGIDTLTWEQDEYGNVTIDITFTSEEMEPDHFTVPGGRSIINVKYEYNEELGITEVYMVYSDGTVSDEPVKIYRGLPGVGIESISEPEINEDNKSVKVTINYTNGDTHDIVIPAGNGIEYIEADYDATSYYLVIHYTLGGSSTVTFPRPHSWYDWSEMPDDDKTGIGDYAFDSANGVIYQKTENGWEQIFKFNNSTEPLQVTFDKNVDNPSEVNMTGKSIFSIPKGSTFYSAGYTIPTVTRSGFRFVGWNTHRDVEDHPEYGYFTDLTPVYSNMTLYAIWEQL